jgi:hypothetical protein
MSRLEAGVTAIFDDKLDLLLRKHRAYGPGNIAGAPGGWRNGLIVRLHDKMERVKHIVYEGGTDEVGEALDETMGDVLNYAAIWLACERGLWPGIPATKGDTT